MSKLYYRASAMNSGKSTALLQVAYNYEERGMRILLLKPSVDTKGGASVVSRTGLRREVDLIVTPELDLKTELLKILAEASNTTNPIECILVDESQFLKRFQVNALFGIAVQQHVPVIAYGLRSDFQSNAFEGSLRLLEIAHSIEELKTICRCGRKAILNGRKNSKGEWVRSGDQVAIDGEQVEYESLCGSCYLEEVEDFTNKPEAVSTETSSFTVVATEGGKKAVVISNDDSSVATIIDMSSHAPMPEISEVQHRRKKSKGKEEIPFPTSSLEE